MSISFDWQELILTEIGNKKMPRKAVAHTYAILIRHDHRDWTAINQAIIERWSKSALIWIKTQAWKRNRDLEKAEF